MATMNKFLHTSFFKQLELQDADNKLAVGPYPLGESERSWLHEVMHYPEATWFLDKEYVKETQSVISATTEDPTIIHKATTSSYTIKPEVFRLLHTTIREQRLCKLTYYIQNRYKKRHSAILHKLEFSVAQKKWFVRWVRITGDEMEEKIRLTPLESIVYIEQLEVLEEKFEVSKQFTSSLEHEKQMAVIQFKPKWKDLDPQRFLQAFSIFEKEVEKKEDVLQLKVLYSPLDEAFLLSKVRMFGPHAEVVSPVHLRERIVQSALQALGNYEEI
ncbi:WYL domain-containing protein [Ureibacillus sp. MALMAid1270]|uniref:WYL domain-containing protein n=1 Tax=Ureibacillus sp. MALMAid1270 TaxID=3411629 RepID=UPI003BA456C8